MFLAVCSHPFEDAVVCQLVSEGEDGVLRGGGGCTSHSQGQGVRRGTKPQHAGAVGPHTTHTWSRAACKRTEEERERGQKVRQSSFSENRQEPSLGCSLIRSLDYSICKRE